MTKIQVAHLAISLYLYFIKLEKQESRNQIRPTIFSLKPFLNRTLMPANLFSMFFLLLVS